MTKLVVFDIDGTILDSHTVFERIVIEYSRENGLPVPCLDTIQTGYGAPYDHDFKWGGTREEQVKHLYATYRISDQRSREGIPEFTPLLYDGVVQGLEHLKDLGHTLAIVTSKPKDPLEHMLEQYKLKKIFSGMRHGNDEKMRGEKEKPAPDQLTSLVQELGFHPDETVMIGDTTMDMVMGRAAKTHTLGVTWGAHHRDLLEEAGAHHIVDDHFDEVPITVKKIFDEF